MFPFTRLPFWVPFVDPQPIQSLQPKAQGGKLQTISMVPGSWLAGFLAVLPLRIIILSRNPSFQKTIRIPGETAVSLK